MISLNIYFILFVCPFRFSFFRNSPILHCWRCWFLSSWSLVSCRNNFVGKCKIVHRVKSNLHWHNMKAFTYMIIVHSPNILLHFDEGSTTSATLIHRLLLSDMSRSRKKNPDQFITILLLIIIVKDIYLFNSLFFFYPLFLGDIIFILFISFPHFNSLHCRLLFFSCFLSKYLFFGLNRYPLLSAVDGITGKNLHFRGQFSIWAFFMNIIRPLC